MRKYDYIDLTEEEIDAVTAICDDFETEDRAIRDRQIREWRRLDLMWNGFNNYYWDSVAHDWRTWGNSFDGGTDDGQSGYYDKNINVLRAYMETIIAALSATVPPIRCLPDDVDNVNDTLTAKAGSKIGELIYNYIDAPSLWVRALWIYCMQGMVAAHSYSDEDESYGSVDVRETEDQEVDGEQKICPSCGMVLDEKQVELSEDIADMERDEFDPGDDDIVLHDLLNKNIILCPQCQIEVDPELRKNKIVVTRITGVTSQPKSRQCLDIEGGLYVKVPNWAKDQKDCPYVFYDRETHYTNILEEFPELKDELEEFNTKLTDADGNYLYERWGRLNPQYRGDYPLNTPTLRRKWLRISTFNACKDEKVEKSLRKKFPDGFYGVWVNEQFVGACNQSLDDHWTLLKNPMSNFVTYDALATLVTAIQEITVNLVSLELQCIEHSIPQTFFNPKFLNAEQYRNTEVAPGAMFPTKTIGENRNISDGFHTLQTATVPPELGPFGSKINELGQFTSGAMPQTFGGTSNSSSRTASQYAMQRNGAQNRLSALTGRNINTFWKTIFSKMIPAYMKEMLEDERLVKMQGSDSFTQVVIRKSQTDGKIGSYRLEAPEGLPQSIDQIRETIMNLLQTNNEQIIAAIASPENLPVLQKVIGLNDFNIQGENDREKQLEEIGLLMNSGPLPSPMGQEMPSVMPELMVDNHQIEAEICRNWLVSEKGRQAKTDNPGGYRNVLLHLQVHMQMLQGLASPVNQPQPQGNQMQPGGENKEQMRPELSRN